MSTKESSEQRSVWSISVKTFGSEIQTIGETTSSERVFVVDVSPEDDLRSLYDKIEIATGLKASQQRLIYRGRLIDGFHQPQSEITAAAGDSDSQVKKEYKIKDIVGLSNGHTIHLVPKREDRKEENEATGGADASSTPGTNDDNNETDISSGSSALLTSLLGLNVGNEVTPSAGNATGRATRSSRFGSRRRVHHRLSSEDLEIPDAGSMEAVRQGLLTMHTILPPALTHFSSEQQMQSPLDVNRRWYIGQWIDCRDTVNHWLEATIADIVLPDEILPPCESSSTRRKRGREALIQPVNDPVVAGTDLEGRRRLLLEPCSEGDSDDEGGELAGFRRRDNVDVQLLLIHYNGWPHRWDEWIRSDSERIRPFRVRTRHPASSSTALPTPQSHFANSPNTFIRSSDEHVDRRALLPELSRVMDSINTLLATASNSFQPTRPENIQRETGEDSRLPWSMSDTDNLGELYSNERRETIGLDNTHETVQPSMRRQLAALSPLLDRLGRTLVDAAPHIASLAASMTEEQTPGETNSGSPSIEDRTSTLGGFLSLLNHDRRRSGASSEEATVVSEEEGGRSMILTSRRLPSHPDTSSIPAAESSEGQSTVSDETLDRTAPEPCQSIAIDPDYTDFATGVVNTTRGEVRSGPRSRRGQSDEFAGLLGAYLAAASLAGAIGDAEADGGDNLSGLARLLRERGSGNGGIDIHIHAVVTAPGGPALGATNGGLNLLTPIGGIATAGVSERSPSNGNRTNAFGNLFSSSRDRRENQSTRQVSVPTIQQHEEDLGIFEELYSETPEPIDPSSLNPTETIASTTGNVVVNSWEGSDLANRESVVVRESFIHQTSRPRGELLNAMPGLDNTNEQSRRRGVWNRLFSRRRS